MPNSPHCFDNPSCCHLFCVFSSVPAVAVSLPYHFVFDSVRLFRVLPFALPGKLLPFPLNTHIICTAKGGNFLPICSALKFVIPIPLPSYPMGLSQQGFVDFPGITAQHVSIQRVRAEAGLSRCVCVVCIWEPVKIAKVLQNSFPNVNVRRKDWVAIKGWSELAMPYF